MNTSLLVFPINTIVLLPCSFLYQLVFLSPRLPPTNKSIIIYVRLILSTLLHVLLKQGINKKNFKNVPLTTELIGKKKNSCYLLHKNKTNNTINYN